MGKRTSYTQEQINQVCQLKLSGGKHRDIAEEVLGATTKASSVWHILDKHLESFRLHEESKRVVPEKHDGAKILILDIEVSPIISATWGIWQQNVGLDMILEDWYVMSWSAKWFHNPSVMYDDCRECFDGSSEAILEDALKDYRILSRLWDLLNEADIIVTQNGKAFDEKKLNARFLALGLRPPSPFQHIDTLQIAKKHFAFTSNKLKFMTEKFNQDYKKAEHAKYPGFKLWKGCLMGDPDAWDEMRDYNIGDVLSLEELFITLAPWTSIPNLDVYHDRLDNTCLCGASHWMPDGYAYTSLGKFERVRCVSCGAFQRGRENLLSTEKMKSLKADVK